MVLILSETTDFTTHKIAKWLEHFGKEVMILTENDEIDIISIHDDKIYLKLNDKNLTIPSLEAYWYRRGNFKFYGSFDHELPEELKNDQIQQTNSISELLHARLLTIPNLGSFFNADLNRVNVLWKARECGLKVPHIGIFNTKKDIIAFKKKYKKIILKPLGNGLSFIQDNKLYVNYTALFTDDDIEKLPDTFPPSLFMEYINKKYEVRVFYLDGECYSLVTFSQEDPQTQIDFRRYNKVRPNRNSAYILPENVTYLIQKLMNNLMLNTGSIDVIVNPKDEFVFLEINPVGQFLNVDYLCNYGLTKKIASYLINNVV